MDGDGRAESADAYATAAAAAVAAAVADQHFQQLSHAQLMALQAQAEQQQEHDPDASPEGQVRKPRKLRKPNDVARCQVDGCGRDLSDAKLYLRRYSVCEPHFKAEWVMLSGGRFRFCQQCNKFQPLDNFAGNRRSCKARSEDRNLRRRKQRTDERALTGDDSDPGAAAGRALLKMQGLGGGVGPLALPSRAALGDNGMLRQLGADPTDPTGLSSFQYAQQVQQLLASNGALALGGLGPVAALGPMGSLAPAGLGGGGGPPVGLPPGLDLAALVGQELGGFGSPSGANALSLLTAAAANGAAGLARSTADQPPGNGMLQQLQLAQLLAKGGGGGAAATGVGAMSGLGGGGGVGGAASGLAAALGAAGMGLPPGVLNGTAGGSGPMGSILNGGAGPGGGGLAQQLILSTAAAVGGAAGPGGGAGGGGGGLPDGGSGGGLDLQNLLAQQLLQQSGAAGQAPMFLLSNPQNAMLLGLEQLLHGAAAGGPK